MVVSFYFPELKLASACCIIAMHYGCAGMEVTSCLAEKAKSVSVVDLIKVPFQLALGQQVGSVLQKVHQYGDYREF